MSGQRNRLPNGGTAIDRGRPLRFRFAGRAYQGYAGDTLASALLANGVRLAGRSFKLHRPRGLIGSGVEEANVLVEVGEGARLTTNLRATEVELREGLDARPVNAWPSLHFDLTSVNSILAPFLKAGFYYKTFMWPRWSLFEGTIRRAAGLGRPSPLADDARYEQRHAHCDLLVVGAGSAGRAAARVAAEAGEEVILADSGRIDTGEQPAPGIRRLDRTTAIAHYDNDLVALVERPLGELTEQRLWLVRARQVIYATGAFERPLLFPNNDLPGVMLASAALDYATRFGAAPGARVVVATNNSAGLDAAQSLAAAGVAIYAIIDLRDGSRVVRSHGRGRTRGVTVEQQGKTKKIECDTLLMSGGLNPDVALFTQAGGKLAYDPDRACFRPAAALPTVRCAGAANGCFSIADATNDGVAAALGQSYSPKDDFSILAEWTPAGDESATYVDFQNDVTVADIRLAHDENFRSVEHLKRYTTLGMAVDQGKTSNVNALAVMGVLTGQSPGDVGTTRFRPPYVPTAVGAFAGLYRGSLAEPYRQTPLHDRMAALGGKFEDYGGWQRAAYFAPAGESREAAMRREALAVRHAVGLFDASPLGKIEVVGPDAGEFLDRIYANRMSTLAVGKGRYGLMLSELGVIIDDGVAIRLADDRYLVGTTSAGAGKIAATLEEWLQCEWRDLRVIVAPVTTEWGTVTVAGPAAREVLVASGCECALDSTNFPHMTFRSATIAGLNARIARVSFTGELSFEVSVAANQAPALWDALAAAAEPLGGLPAGIDAWMLLRLEKGFLHVGSDTDGTTVPADIGWTKVARRTGDFIGKRSLLWAVNQGDDRLQFVGLDPLDQSAILPIGAHLRSDGPSRKTDGFVTSAAFSPTLQRPIALALVHGGRRRVGEETALMNGVRCRIVTPGWYDCAGERMHG